MNNTTYTIHAGQPFDLALDSIAIDSIVQDLPSIKLHASVKVSLLDDDADAVAKINSTDNSNRFTLEGSSGEVRMLTEEESISLDGDPTSTLINGVPLIAKIYWDIWLIDAAGNDLPVQQGRLNVLKPVTLTR